VRNSTMQMPRRCVQGERFLVIAQQHSVLPLRRRDPERTDLMHAYD